MDLETYQQKFIVYWFSNYCDLKKEKLLAILRLQKTKSIGDILAKKLIATVGNAAEIFSEKKNTLHKINGIGSYAIQNLLNDSYQHLAEKELQYILIYYNLRND